MVLEAADRVGGRLYAGTLQATALQTSVFTRRGCPRIMRAAFAGARTYPTWGRGEHVLVHKGVPGRYRGTTPYRIGPLQLASLGVAIARLDRMAKHVPLEAPWEAAPARRWAARTIGAWIDRGNAARAARWILRETMTET
jgi:monoamine oxidase